jgi:hypothetical protein
VLNDEAKVKGALGKLWNLAMEGGHVQDPPVVNGAFLPREKGPMSRTLFLRLVAAVEQASVLLPSNWYTKKGDHNFTASSKTPDLNVVRDRSLLLPAGGPAAAAAAAAAAHPASSSATRCLPSSSSTSADKLLTLTFEQFGEAWFELSKQYCATSNKEDYFEFTGRMLLSVPKGYEKLPPTSSPAVAVAPSTHAALVGVGVGLGLGLETTASQTIGLTSSPQMVATGNSVLSRPSSANPIEVKIISRPGSRAGNGSPLGSPWLLRGHSCEEITHNVQRFMI